MTESISRKGQLSAIVVGLTLAFGASAQTTGSPAAGASKAPASASAKAPVSTPAKAPASADQAFVRKAAMGGLAEVEFGKLAQQKASSDEVKQFASRMVQDHSKANDELKQIASSKGIEVPSELDRKHKNDYERLNKLSGAEFDRAYMNLMVDDHKKDVSDFKKEADSGKDADIKSFASKTLPTLQEHMQLAQKTNDAVKKSSAPKKTASK
jgi:putative membrane protein